MVCTGKPALVEQSQLLMVLARMYQNFSGKKFAHAKLGGGIFGEKISENIFRFQAPVAPIVLVWFPVP